MAFPSGPYTDGQSHTESGVTYTFSQIDNVWKKAATNSTTPVFSNTTLTGASSITGGGALSANLNFSLVSDSATPGNDRYYGTNPSGVKGFQPTTNFYYNNSASYLTDKTSFSIVGANTVVGGGNFAQTFSFSLVNDSAAPGNRKVYGTDASGVKGWRDLPADLSTIPANAVNGNSRQVLSSASLFNHGGTFLAANIKRYLSGDVASPGAFAYYGTNASGARGWQTFESPVLVGRLTRNLTITYSVASYIRSTGDYIPILANKTYLFRLVAITQEPGRLIQAVTSAPLSIVCGCPSDSNGFSAGSMIFKPPSNMNIFVRAMTGLTHIYSDLAIYRLD